MRCQVTAIIAVFNNRDYKLTVDKFKKDYKGNKTVLLQFLKREEYYFLL